MVKRLLITIAILFLPSLCQAAATVYLDDDAGCGGHSPCYTTWATAISAVDSGGTIKVRNGRWTGQVNVNKSCTIEPADSSQTQIICDGEYTGNPVDQKYWSVFKITASNVTVDGVTAKRSYGNLFSIEGGNNVTLKNSRAEDCYHRGGYIGEGATNVTVDNCVFTRTGRCFEFCNFSGKQCRDLGWGDAGGFMVNDASDVMITNSEISYSAGEVTACTLNASKVLYKGNKIFGNQKMNFYVNSNTSGTICIRDNIFYAVDDTPYGELGDGNVIITAECGGLRYGPTSDVLFINNRLANLTLQIASEQRIDCLGYPNTNARLIHNTILQSGTRTNIEIQSTRVTGVIIKNNLLVNSGTGSYISGAGSYTDTNNIKVKSAASAGLVKTTGWSSVGGGSLSVSDFDLAYNSTARDAATYLTTVSSAGAGAVESCSVSDWRYFTYPHSSGMAITADLSDKNYATITNRSSSTISWTGAVDIDTGDEIYWRNLGPNNPKPDIGANEYTSQPTNNPPIVQIDSPLAGACIEDGNDATIECTASDPDSGDSIASYSWTDNGVVFSTSADPGLYGDDEWTADSTHTLRVTVTDQNGGTAYDEITIQFKTSCEAGGEPGETTETWGERTGIDTHTGVWEDSHLRGGSYDTNNYGSNAENWQVSARAEYDNSYNRVLVYQINLADLPVGCTVSGASIHQYNWDAPDYETALNIYQLCDSPFVESEVNFNCYSYTAEVCNEWDQADHEETGTILFTGTETTTPNQWVALTANADGKTFLAAQAGNVITLVGKEAVNQEQITQYYSSEYATTSLRPYLSITYTAEAPPATPEIVHCRFVTPDASYGENAVIRAYCEWEASVAFTYVGATPHIVFETNAGGGDDLELALETATTVKQIRHYFSGTVDADDNSADLTHIDQGGGLDIILAGGDTCTGTLDIPTAGGIGAPDYYSDIIIDTSAPEPGPGDDPLPATLYLCDEDGAEWTPGEDKTFATAGELVYLCMGFQTSTSDKDIGCHNVGSALDLGIETSLLGINGVKTYWKPYSGLGTYKWLWAHQLVAGERTPTAIEWVMTDGDIEQLNSTTIVDIAGNPLSTYSTGITDPFDGEGDDVFIAVPKTDWNIGTLGDYTTYQAFLAAMGRSIPGDQFNFSSALALLNTAQAGEDGTEIIYNVAEQTVQSIRMNHVFNRIIRARCG